MINKIFDWLKNKNKPGRASERLTLDSKSPDRNLSYDFKEDDFFAAFPSEWILSLEFAESHSSKLKKILKLAKENPSFTNILDINVDANEKTLPKSFLVLFKAEQILEFRKIYDVVKGWKSTVVKINQKPIDKKTLSKILRCFTDRVKSNDPMFCYGASPYTINPFGCHRIKIHSHRWNTTPWYDYLVEENGQLLVDKKRIFNEMQTNLKDYQYCPALKPREIFNKLSTLPQKIDISNNSWIVKQEASGMPRVDRREDVERQQRYASGQADIETEIRTAMSQRGRI